MDDGVSIHTYIYAIRTYYVYNNIASRNKHIFLPIPFLYLSTNHPKPFVIYLLNTPLTTVSLSLSLALFKSTCYHCV